MSWFVAMFTSTAGRKYVMALTGLFLCTFLVIHLSGNLLTLIPDGGLSFNSFTYFMEHMIVVKILEIVLFAGFILHIIQALIVTLQNSKSRPVKYSVSAGGRNSTWMSMNMGILGTIILIFLVIHLRDFFYELKFGEHDLGTDARGNIDLYKEVVATFGMLPYAALYFVAMFGLGYHLWHGFQSGFRSPGITHKKYVPIIDGAGKIYTIIITGGFMFLPVYWYLVQHVK